MPDKPTSESGADGVANEAPQEEEHLSRAERRAARSGRAVRADPPPWNHGKVTGARGSAPARKQFSSRRSGG
jgi:hypothetical protein